MQTPEQTLAEIMVSRPAGTPGPAHGKAWLAVDASAALLFDRASGARLTPKAKEMLA